MDRGELVPDSVTNEMVKDRLGNSDVANGFLLDGFPRNTNQAQVLDQILADKKMPLDAVLELKIDNAQIIKRLSGRRTCQECGAPSHVEFEKPKVAGVCDKCQGGLYQREDDKEEVLTRRLDIYSEQTMPIIKYYEKFGLLKNISALGDVTEITNKAIAALK
jgi:adenylate kinase